MQYDIKEKVKRMISKNEDYYRISNSLNTTVIKARYYVEIVKNGSADINNIEENIDKEEFSIYLSLRKRKDLSIDDISKKMGRSIESLENEYNSYIKSKEIQTLDQDLEYMISRMIYAGWTVKQISDTLNVNYDIVLHFKTNYLYPKNEIDDHINVFKLAKFSRYDCKIGNKYKISANDIDYDGHRIFINVTVLDKYPNIAVTDKGDYMYIDLYNGIKIN